jgi:HK97 gp10 family phage protein
MSHIGRELSLGEMGLKLAERSASFYAKAQKGLRRAARAVERTAKSEFGTYQPEQGPHPEWPELAEATMDERVREGYTPNDPLLRSGDMKKHTSFEVHGLEAAIGSTDPKMVFHEFGTEHMPARPVFGPAAFRNKEVIQRILGDAAVEGVTGQERIHHALGYDFDTKGE